MLNNNRPKYFKADLQPRVVIDAELSKYLQRKKAKEDAAMYGKTILEPLRELKTAHPCKVLIYGDTAVIVLQSKMNAK